MIALVVLILLTLPISTKAESPFSLENATAIVRTLSVDIGPRPMGSPAEWSALEYSVERFRAYGCDTAYIMPFNYSSQGNTRSGIAVGIRRGSAKGMIVIGSHIDSASPEVPGADDNASGTAVVLELSRILADRQLQSTLVFCCFGGEEEGLEGSRYFVNNFPGIDSVGLMVQIDMANGLGVIDIDPDSPYGSAPPWLVRATLDASTDLGYGSIRYPTHALSLNYASSMGSGSDHESFLEKGIPAIDLTTDITKPIHSPRDNFENFDPRGLHRSGEIALRLVEQFDGNIPDRSISRYWLYVVTGVPAFVPYWILYIVLGASVLAALIALFFVRKRRESPGLPDRVRWSGVKLSALMLIVTTFAWFSSDLVGLLTGIRHPWYTSLPPYYLLAAVSGGIGLWLAFHFGNNVHLIRCPYVYLKRALILLLPMVGIAAILSIEVAVGFIAATLLISLAMLIRQPVLKIVLLLLSPVWMFRVVFSEWDLFFFRMLSGSTHGGTAQWIMFNVVPVVFLTIYALPIVYAAAAVSSDTPGLRNIAIAFRSRWSLITLGVTAVVLVVYLVRRPVYDQYWYRSVLVDQEFTPDGIGVGITARSREYLDGLHVMYGLKDTLLGNRTRFIRFPSVASTDTSWLSVQRMERRTQTEEGTVLDMDLVLRCKKRPFRVSLRYEGGGGAVADFSSPWEHESEDGGRTIRWFSFPDSVLTVPVHFTIPPGDSVEERIAVTFSELAVPMTFEREYTYVIPRSTVRSTVVLRP